MLEQCYWINEVLLIHVPLSKICDINRQENREKPNFVARKIEYLLCRTILVPVEVLGHWYDYFTNCGEKVGMSDLVMSRLLIGQEGELSNPRKIGLHYYNKIYPHKYLNTVSENASLDADAYTHFGVFVILIACIILLIIHLMLTFLEIKNTLSVILSYVGILILAVNIPQPLLQAVLVPQRVVVILALLWWLKLTDCSNALRGTIR